jgi:DNA-binding response OmpR family regulator
MGKRILVVEDDEKSRKLLRDVLQFHGFDVHAVPTGEDALANARSVTPDAALLDIELPGINGFDVLARLRGESAGASMPVIAVTASVMDHDRKRIIAAGFDAYVPKPVNIRELVKTLNDLLSKSET